MSDTPVHIYLCEYDWLFQDTMAYVIDYNWAEVPINNGCIPVATTQIYGASDQNVKVESFIRDPCAYYVPFLISMVDHGR